MKEIQKVRLANPTRKDIEDMSQNSRVELIQKEKQKLYKIKAQIFNVTSELKKDEQELLKQKKTLETQKEEIEQIGNITKKRIKKINEINKKISELLYRLNQKRKKTLKKVEDLTKKFNAVVRLIDLVEEVELTRIMKKQNIGYEAAKTYIARNRALNQRKLGRIPGGRA